MAVGPRPTLNCSGTVTKRLGLACGRFYRRALFENRPDDNDGELSVKWLQVVREHKFDLCSSTFCSCPSLQRASEDRSQSSYFLIKFLSFFARRVCVCVS